MLARDKEDVSPNDPGFYGRVQDFLTDARKLSISEMKQKHAEAFLLHHGALGVLNKPIGPQATMMLEGKPQNGAPQLQQDFLVFPIKVSGRSPFPHFISVGRTRNNDVVIADTSLSKFHAFFRTTPDGGMVLQDAGSTNGTELNGDKVPTQQGGAALLLQSGAIVRFGAVEMTFLDTESFANLVKMLAQT